MVNNPYLYESLWESQITYTSTWHIGDTQYIRITIIITMVIVPITIIITKAPSIYILKNQHWCIYSNQHYIIPIKRPFIKCGHNIGYHHKDTNCVFKWAYNINLSLMDTSSFQLQFHSTIEEFNVLWLVDLNKHRAFTGSCCLNSTPKVECYSSQSYRQKTDLFQIVSQNSNKALALDRSQLCSNCPLNYWRN